VDPSKVGTALDDPERLLEVMMEDLYDAEGTFDGDIR